MSVDHFRHLYQLNGSSFAILDQFTVVDQLHMRYCSVNGSPLIVVGWEDARPWTPYLFMGRRNIYGVVYKSSLFRRLCRGGETRAGRRPH